MIKASAITFSSVHNAKRVHISLPELEQGELLVRTEISTVSPGTELRCFDGKQPDSVPFPFIPGYSTVGIVEKINSEGDLSIGDRVFCSGTKRADVNLQWGGHVSCAIVDATSAFKIPTGCSPETASFAKLVAIALRGVHVCQCKPEDKVAVVGLGPIGMLSARLHVALGSNVLAVDQELTRVELAKSAGVPASLVRDSIQNTVADYFGALADIVVDATGSANVLRSSMEAAKNPDWGDSTLGQSKLVIQGSYPDSFTLPYQDAFRKELTIYMPRDTTPTEISKAIRMLASGEIHVTDLISWIASPTEAQSAYDLLRFNRSSMTVSFDWRIDA